MFSGMSNHSIDSKGRIVLPAKFREELGSSFYLVKGFGNCCVQAMSVEVYEKFSNKILEMPVKKARVLQYTFNATAQLVTPNAQGRVVIPSQLRLMAGIGDEALVIGLNNRIEIWNNAKFDEYMGTQQDELEDALSLLTF